MKAIWNGTVVAQSDDTVVVEGNHYFPADADQPRRAAPLRTSTRSARGRARRRTGTLEVDGTTNVDAAWFYLEPKDAAAQIRDSVAFWKGVTVEA